MPSPLENTKVLAHFSRTRPNTAAFVPWSDTIDAYYNCGCHPDMVERIWDQIGKALPADCRSLVHSAPALVHPTSNVILAIGIGTQYGLRVPASADNDAAFARAKTTTKWSNGTVMDIRSEFGDDWIFGAWLPEELNWCKKVYEMFS